jgi:predicted amino acid-binding ACT domain protein
VGDQTAARLRFLEGLGRKAKEWGVGLHIGDRRPGKIRGEWITVRPFEPERFRLWTEDVLSELIDDVVDYGVPVTIVGPARVGSSLAIFRTLTAHGVGIVGLSVTAMQEMAFINFVAVQRVPAQAAGAGAHGLQDGLAAVIQRCGYGSVNMLGTADAGAATDYQVLIGMPQPIVVDADERARPRPLWMTWDVPFGEVDLEDVVSHLTESLKKQKVEHVLEYGRARLAGDGRVRGRAKVSVKLTGHQPRQPGPREVLRRLCTVLEDDIRGGVAARARLNESEVRIRVMWRERWLGSWEYPL